jgi:hypothetical protein
MREVMNQKPPAQLLFFWDYDTQWGADRSRSRGGPKAWGPLEFENTERLLELHAEHDVPACFAVVGAAALPGERPYHDPNQIRRIHKAGHEIASHSLRHEWLPGLSARELKATLTQSKDALEQCLGVSVVSFVPPFNQPFDYPRRGAFSLSERREARGCRNDLRVLCEALAEAGYQFCRVCYRPIVVRLGEWLSGRPLDRPGHLESIAGVRCARLNTPGGFGSPALAMLDRCAESGGLVVVYGHPHSLADDTAQGEATLIPFLRDVNRLRREGRVQVCLPSTLSTVQESWEVRLVAPARIDRA